MAILKLNGKIKEAYLEKLTASLTKARKLDLACDEELEKIVTQINFLKKTQYSGIYDAIKIDEESGFIHVATIVDLMAEKENASANIARLPSLDGIIENISAQLHTNDSDFSKHQKRLREVLFYNSLIESDFPATASNIKKEKIISREENPKAPTEYDLLMGGYDSTKMMWNYYSILLIHTDKGIPLLGKGEITRNFSNYFDNTCFGYEAEDVYNSLNKLKQIGVVKVERNVLGPFYSKEVLSETETPPTIKEILQDYPNGFITFMEENSVENSQLYLDPNSFKEQKQNAKLNRHLKLNIICSSDKITNSMYDLYADCEYPVRCITVNEN